MEIQHNLEASYRMTIQNTESLGGLRFNYDDFSYLCSYMQCHTNFPGGQKVVNSVVIKFKDADDSAIIHQQTYESVDKMTCLPWLSSFKQASKNEFW